jgi:hypothetical protein
MAREIQLDAAYGYRRPGLGQTTDVNGPNGSVDQGGPVDSICAAWVAVDSPAAETVFLLQKSGAQQWSYENFGIPYYAPSLIGSVQQWSLTLLGAFAGGYHGYARSGGKTSSMLLWGFLGSMFPVPTTAVAVVMGYGQRKGGRSSK